MVILIPHQEEVIKQLAKEQGKQMDDKEIQKHMAIADKLFPNRGIPRSIDPGFHEYEDQPSPEAEKVMRAIRQAQDSLKCGLEQAKRGELSDWPIIIDTDDEEYKNTPLNMPVDETRTVGYVAPQHRTWEFRFAKIKEEAVAPTRAHPLDSGYDLTIIDIVKDYGKTKLYGTGIKIQPPEGVYFDMVARSSISKTGYILTNSIGIIDNQYRGELLVALTKIDESQPDLELPIRIAQLIPRQWLDLQPIEILEDELTHEERGEKGWGSTGR